MKLASRSVNFLFIVKKQYVLYFRLGQYFGLLGNFGNFVLPLDGHQVNTGDASEPALREFEVIVDDQRHGLGGTATTQDLDKPWCISVFEDNAGVVAFDEESAVCFKVETSSSRFLSLLMWREALVIADTKSIILFLS